MTRTRRRIAQTVAVAIGATGRRSVVFPPMAEDPVDPEQTTDEPVDVDVPAETEAKASPATTADEPAKPAKPEVVRKKVVSKRVTPKGGAQGVPSGAKKGSTAARTHSVAAEHGDEDDKYSKRYTPPAAKYAPGPSPWWVPAIMFGLLIIGALVIMLNYMSVFGEPANVRLVIGLAFILGGIITATQYR